MVCLQRVCIRGFGSLSARYQHVNQPANADFDLGFWQVTQTHRLQPDFDLWVLGWGQKPGEYARVGSFIDYSIYLLFSI